MIQNDYTIKLLNIQDEYIKILNINFTNNTYYIDIEQLINKETSCPNCGGLELTKNSTYKRKIRYTPIKGFPTFINFYQIRYKCKYCGRSFNQPNLFIESKKSLSIDLRKHIINETTTKQSFKDIANKSNVSQTTISNEFKKELHNYRGTLSRIICIDEFKASTIAGKYALIIGDPESGEIIDILPSRLQDYIYHYFNTIPENERFSVEYVVTDLFESYRTICKTLFWKSIHIADRFHWIKLSTEAFNKIRIRIMKICLKTKEKDKIIYANALKRYSKLLIANTHSKEDWFFYQPIPKNQLALMNIQSAIEYCINKDSELEEAYHLLQELYKIARYSSFENAKQNILDWCDKVNTSEFNLEELKHVTLTYKSWINEIVNSFILDPITHKRLSNGFIEGKNNFCKTIKRIGFGYSDFDVFRYKIITTNKKAKQIKK